MTRCRLVAVVSLTLMLFVSGLAFAENVCTTFNSANGAASFPGTYVGTVGSSCQIGILSLNTGDMAYVSTATNPSIYEFYFGGGNMTIQEELGNNGIGYAVDVELYSLASLSSTSGTVLASIQIPYTSAPSGEYTLISNQTLGAGYYAIDTYLASGDDPRYQVNITATPAAAVPEPGSLLLLAISLSGFGAFVRRRRA